MAINELPDVEAGLQHELATHLRRESYLPELAYVLLSGLAVFLLWPLVPGTQLAAWFTLVGVVSVVRLLVRRDLRTGSGSDAQVFRRT
ncbi:MAG: hypothetical protein KC645_10820, partial [Gemmatimonadetes bacterium]|nr:hypothetical protein [Gemmatimonadota bacterium]